MRRVFPPPPCGRAPPGPPGPPPPPRPAAEAPPSPPMSAILDHLTAILVGATLLAAAIYVQQRERQQAVEAAVHGNVQGQTVAFVGTLERDLENMRTDREAARRLGLDSTRSYTRVA